MPGAALALSFEAIEHLKKILGGRLAYQPEHCDLCTEIREAVA